jgi:hypothetical protein
MDYFYSALGYSTAEPAAVEEEAAAAAAPAGQYAQPEQEAAGGEADAPVDGDAYANTVRPIRHGAALARGRTLRLRPAGGGIEGPKEPRDALAQQFRCFPALTLTLARTLRLPGHLACRVPGADRRRGGRGPGAGCSTEISD